MQIKQIKDNVYQVELSAKEQATVELESEYCNISNASALDCIFADGFDCYVKPIKGKE